MTVFQSSFYWLKLIFKSLKCISSKIEMPHISAPSIIALIKFVLYYWELMVVLSGNPDNRLSRHGSRCHLEKKDWLNSWSAVSPGVPWSVGLSLRINVGCHEWCHLSVLHSWVVSFISMLHSVSPWPWSGSGAQHNQHSNRMCHANHEGAAHYQHGKIQ